MEKCIFQMCVLMSECGGIGKTAVCLESDELESCLISANLCFLSSLGAHLRKANQLQLQVQEVLGLKARRVLRPKR